MRVHYDKSVWEKPEEAFLTEMAEKTSITAEKSAPLHDQRYHTDVWLEKGGKKYSVDVKNFRFKHGIMGFYFAKSHSQWGNSQKERLKYEQNIDIAGEYVVIPYTHQDKPVWAVIDRSTLLKRLVQMFPIDPKKVFRGNPNKTWDLAKGQEPIPNRWWYKEQSPYPGEPIEKRWGIHITPEVFEKIVMQYVPRKTQITDAGGNII